MSVAKRVSEEVAAGVKEKGLQFGEKEKLGGTVGYAIRFEDMTTVSIHAAAQYIMNTYSVIALLTRVFGRSTQLSNI